MKKSKPLKNFTILGFPLYFSRVLSLIALLLVSACATVQKDEQKMENFYTHKNCKVVRDFLISFDKNYAPKLSRGKIFDYSNSQALIGELSGIFVTDQICTKKILSVSNKLSGYTKVAILSALIYAEYNEAAKEFAVRHSLSPQLEHFKDRKGIKLTVSEYHPSTNDLLIGAYKATGDNLYIDNILQNFKTADIRMVKDAIRYGFVISKFGSSSSPYKDHHAKIIQSLKKKYYKEKDPKPFSRLMTLSTAFWALKSLAANDNNLASHLKDFFAEGDMKSILLIEQNNFSNYLTGLVMDMSDVGKFNKKSLTKEEKKGWEFVNKNKKLIADYEELKEPNMMELVK